MVLDIPNYCQTLDSSLTASIFPNALGQGWMNIVFISLIGMTFLYTLLYFAANLFRIPKLEAWARFEFFQVALTAVFAIMLAWAIHGMCHWDIGFLDNARYDGAAGEELMQDCGFGAGKNETTAFCAASTFLHNMENRGQNLFQGLIAVNYGLSYLFKMSWESKPMGIGYTLDPLAGFQQLQNIFMVAISGFTLSYISILVQLRVLEYFLIAMPYYFLPLGLLLRSFAPTREFGGAIMGFAVVSMFFFPLILVLNDLTIYSNLEQFTKEADDYVENHQYTAKDKIDPNVAKDKWGELLNEYEEDRDSDGLPIEKQNRDARTVMTTHFTHISQEQRQKYISEPATDFTKPVIFVTKWVMVYVVAAVVLPILNFIIYVEIARELTRLFGTEMDLTNLTRMI